MGICTCVPLGNRIRVQAARISLEAWDSPVRRECAVKILWTIHDLVQGRNDLSQDPLRMYIECWMLTGEGRGHDLNKVSKP